MMTRLWRLRSDGYATGLTVLALEKNGMGKVRRSVAASMAGARIRVRPKGAVASLVAQQKA